MDFFERLQPRAVSTDDYSHHFYAHDHFAAPLVETPRLTLPRVKPKAHSKNVSAGPSRASDFRPVNSFSNSDPALDQVSYGTCLIIGRSGTGKSTFLKEMVSRLPRGRKLYLVNVRSDEIAEYEKIHRGGQNSVSTLTLTTLDKMTSNSTLIVEDIIYMKEAQQTRLREAVNYTAHHKSCKIFCVTHTVFKTGVYALLPLFNYIILTSSPANAPIIRKIFQQFSIEKQDAANCLRRFQSAFRDHSATGRSPVTLLFFFDCTKMTIGFSDEGLTPNSCKSLGSIQQSDPTPPLAESTPVTSPTQIAAPETSGKLFEHFFPPSSPSYSKAHGLFGTITSSSAATRYLNPSTLGFSFPSRDGSSAIRLRVSLIDYIVTALSVASRPNKKIRALHRFLLQRCDLPSTAVVNRYLNPSSKRHRQHVRSRKV